MFQYPFREVVLECFSTPSGKCFWDVSEPPQGSGFGMFLYLRKCFWDVSVPPQGSVFGMFQYPLREVVVISEDAQIRDDVKALEKYILEVRHGCLTASPSRVT